MAGISLGEADLRSETGALEEGLDWARAPDRQRRRRRRPARARPSRSTRGCATTRASRARAAAAASSATSAAPRSIPSSCEIIEQAYLPTAEEVERAQATVAKLEADEVGTLESGEFLDAAVLGAARQVVALAARYGTAGSSG